MRKLFSRLWADDKGAIISVELLFVIVILVIGLIAGLATLRSAIVSEFGELAVAIASLDPGYSIASIIGSTGGSDGTTVTSNGQAPIITITASTGWVTSIGTTASTFNASPNFIYQTNNLTP